MLYDRHIDEERVKQYGLGYGVAAKELQEILWGGAGALLRCHHDPRAGKEPVRTGGGASVHHDTPLG